MLKSQATIRATDAQQIIDAAIAQAAANGLRSLTMRDLAQSVEKSTTVVVNLFGTKSGLIQAVGEKALQLDSDFHARFFQSVAGLDLNRDTLLTLVQNYLRSRTSDEAGFARVWEALLLESDSSSMRLDLMRRWDVMRKKAWSDHLAANPRLRSYADPLIAWATIEHFYAGALQGRTEYEIIAAEGLGGLIDHAFGLPERPATATFWYRQNLTLPQAPAEGLEADSIQRKLLDIAADQILAGGVTAITNRSVSAVAGTSTSTIAYHWPDMRRFVLDAVWHSVFRDMPRYLAGHHLDGDAETADLDSWTRLMAPTVSIRPKIEGFYVRYARLIASICLEARRDPSLRDLAMLLRGPEGGGTYYNRAGVWPADFDLTRLAATRFALWVKGLALTSAATGIPVSEADLIKGADQLVARLAR
ncbi:MAG: TetR family transcriptional regulator [Brevundimonas sp.]|uniref:TetR family transcriptional regulator n=1 Tax=Brevundimonas sp. TaxID=1871086 RepID=UPI0027261B26|nr:TetR family transcriptional regulator [Brevundimonas sp.]MDO9608742.1 TetR family transcriptional regulator [Brevundimonas sp.]